MRTGKLASEAVEDAASALEFREAFFFFSKFAGMGDHGVAGAARGMFDVQHLVNQNVFHSACGIIGAIHAGIQQNLMWGGIVTTILPPSDPRALLDVRGAQLC